MTIRCHHPLVLNLLLATGVAVACAGCGKEEVPHDRAVASGVVTFEGKPLPAGTIGFESVTGPVRTSASIQDGTFKTDRAPLGDVLVTVDTTTIQVGNPAKYVPIPEHYMDPQTSGLKATIGQDGSPDLEFALTK